MAIEHAPGTVVGGRYRLERLLGEGGMGAVWAAEDTATGERCALKLMKDPAGDPEARKRFLREGRAASAVRHPNVVRILDVLEPDGEPPAIVMELLEGESLRALLKRAQKLSPGELAELMVPVVSAVGAAHALGIVHRDLKPENIFLARGPAGERTVKVLDFGIAKLTALDGEAVRSTGITTGAVLGTPAYMAPEQVFAEKHLDHRADVWALGVVFYECLSGVCPTEGENVGQVLKHVVARPFEPLGALVPELPEELSRLVARMLARDPAERPADLHEVADALAPFASTPAEPFGAPAPRPTSAGELAATSPLRPRNLGREGAAAPLATTPRAGLTRSRHRARIVLASVAAVVVLGAAAAWFWWPVPPAVAMPSPLDPPDAKLACPILRASGIEEPAGWLGAAAAAVACERARVLLGGRPERMLVPAELLDLPREPVAAFPADPYGQPGARDRSVAAAQQRAQAYMDGEVTRLAAGFAVTLSLHRADGSELKRADGHGPGLYEAVRAAMGPLVGPGLISRANRLEQHVAAWARTEDIDATLGVLDLTFAFAHNAGGLPDECRRFEAQSARVGDLGAEGRWLCAYTLGRQTPDLVLEDADTSAAGVATRIRILRSLRQVAKPAHVDLRALFQRETTSRGRSLLAVIESCQLGATDPQAAREWARIAVQSEPKNPEGGWCTPWEQLLTLERNTPDADSVVRAMQAWLPWNSYAWLEPGFKSEGRDPAALPLLRRANLLSPFDAQIAGKYAAGLLAAGDRAAARGVAAALRNGGLPLHDVESESILVRVEASEARFGAALARARKASELLGSDVGWLRAQRFEIAWRALELAVLLGRGREVADLLVERFLVPDPPVLDSNFARVPMRIPAICVRSSAPDRCFQRFRALRQQLPGAITQDTDDFLRGAELYVKRDFEGAARAWRPLLGGSMGLATVLPEAMVDVLERTGAAELAAQVDQEVMKRAGELNGATLGHVRAARRALARGDRAKARALAAQVVEAWARADDVPPALAEMRRLVSQP